MQDTLYVVDILFLQLIKIINIFLHTSIPLIMKLSLLGLLKNHHFLQCTLLIWTLHCVMYVTCLH